MMLKPDPLTYQRRQTGNSVVEIDVGRPVLPRGPRGLIQGKSLLGHEGILKLDTSYSNPVWSMGKCTNVGKMSLKESNYAFPSFLTYACFYNVG